MLIPRAGRGPIHKRDVSHMCADRTVLNWEKILSKGSGNEICPSPSPSEQIETPSPGQDALLGSTESPSGSGPTLKLRFESADLRVSVHSQAS